MVGLDNLGMMPLIYDSRQLDAHTGYIRLSVFFDPATVVPAIKADLEAFAGTRGVILDLRGNPGGVGGMAMGIGGDLVAERDRKLGTMVTRETSMNFVINLQAFVDPGNVVAARRWIQSTP